MSASLVGSEMCIRDSSVVGDQVSRGAAVVHRLGYFETRLLLQAMAPVSYTHLTLPTICSV
eukprot:6805338-Alexandrium_andersonii.AAC.1